MTAIRANGIRIEVESEGPEDAPAFLLIRGLSTQLIQWPRPFLQALRHAGYRVVRFDNRDAGLSQKFSEAGTPEAVAVATGRTPAPYGLADMAADAVGVLDALGIERPPPADLAKRKISQGDLRLFVETSRKLFRLARGALVVVAIARAVVWLVA